MRKQLIKLYDITEIMEYIADEYRNWETGQWVHTVFPPSIGDVLCMSERQDHGIPDKQELYMSIARNVSF